MKLRLRSVETRETFKIEIPNPHNLQDLRELVSQKLPSIPPPSIHLSLNQKDELTSSPEESIQSTGITSGDLIYFTTNPNGFSTVPQTVQPMVLLACKSEESQNSQTLIPKSEKQDETLRTSSREIVDLYSGNQDVVGIDGPKLEDTAESMEVDDDNKSVYDASKSFSVPGFLRKVFTEELGDDGGLNHKLLATAVHAVLLESGFLEFDPVSNSFKSNNFNLSGSWSCSAFYYTLPDIISHGGTVENNVTKLVKIKFQNLGKFCKVYGSLVNGTGMHWVVLNEDKLVPFLNVVWANCGKVVQTMEENNMVSSVLPEREVFEFWREVKDKLVLPLLIDLCENAGLGLPPCFMRLPTELKLKILESLSGVDIAKVSCICSELRYLASSDDLWKQKYIEQFGDAQGSKWWGRTFKERFARSWESHKRRKIAGTSSFCIMRRGRPVAPFASTFPRVIGGDYDLQPNFGQFQVPQPRNVVPHCNLGVGGLDP